MEGPPRRLPPKKDVISALLSESGVYIHLDPRRAGVVVPRWFQKQPELVLQIGLNMAIPIYDLEITDEAVSCTLSFSRSPFWCKLPWTAVYAIVSDKDRRGVVWPEDAPSESQLAKGQKTQTKRPKLKAVGPNDVAEPNLDEGSLEVPTHCGLCSARWAEEQDTCAVCGASREEALAAAKKDPLPFPSMDTPETKPEPRPKKKLASVPSPQPTPSPVLALAPKVEEEKPKDTSDADDDEPEPTNPSGKKDSGKKEKRKLPPYLRVVK